MAVAFHWELWRRHAAKRPGGHAAKFPSDRLARSRYEDRAELLIGIFTLVIAILAGLALPWL
jgi:hypothetical protein